MLVIKCADYTQQLRSMSIWHKNIQIYKGITYLVRTQNFLENKCAYQMVRNVNFLEKFCVLNKLNDPKVELALTNIIRFAETLITIHSIKTFTIILTWIGSAIIYIFLTILPCKARQTRAFPCCYRTRTSVFALVC